VAARRRSRQPHAHDASLRGAAQDRHDAADAALANPLEGKSASAWIKVCLDKQGAVTAKYLASSQPTTLAGEAFVHAIADWTFKPFTHRKAPIAACSLTLLTYPAANAPATETLPAPAVTVATELGSPLYVELESPYDFTGIQISGQAPPTISAKALETHRLQGSKQIQPDANMQAEFAKARRSFIGTSVKLCVGMNGTVISVSLLKSSGFTTYDQKIIREVNRWTFKPFSTPVCSVASFVWRKP
jgi:outer membrane biosynthesis protein TonB